MLCIQDLYTNFVLKTNIAHALILWGDESTFQDMCGTYNNCQMWESAVAEGRIGPNICPRALLCCNFVSVWAGYCCSHSVNFYPQIEFYTKSSRDSCLTKHQHNHSIWWGMYPIRKSSAFTKLAVHFVYKLRATVTTPPPKKNCDSVTSDSPHPTLLETEHVCLFQVNLSNSLCYLCVLW